MSWRFLNFFVMCTSYLHCKASLLLVVGFFLCVVSVFYSCLLLFFWCFYSVLLAIQYFLNISCSFAFASLLVSLTPWF
jgi:hypothetical protein